MVQPKIQKSKRKQVPAAPDQTASSSSREAATTFPSNLSKVIDNYNSLINEIYRQLEKKRHPWAQYFKALVDVRSHSQDLQCTQSSASARLAILEDHHRFIEDFLSKVPKHTFTPNFEELGDNLRREQGSELKKHAARMRWNRFKAKFITKKAKAIVETSGSQGQAEEGVASKGAKKRAADDEDKHVPAKKQKATNEHVSEDSYDNLD